MKRSPMTGLIEMSNSKSSILFLCKARPLTEKAMVEVPPFLKVTKAQYLGFRIACEFDESFNASGLRPSWHKPKARTFRCANCGQTVKYRAYRLVIDPSKYKKTMKKVGIVFGICAALLFLIIMILDWSYLKTLPESEPLPHTILAELILLVLFGAGAIFFGAVGLIGGLQYLLWFRQQNYQYVCEMLSAQHSLAAEAKGEIGRVEEIGRVARWKTLPPFLRKTKSQ